MERIDAAEAVAILCRKANESGFLPSELYVDSRIAESQADAVKTSNHCQEPSRRQWYVMAVAKKR